MVDGDSRPQTAECELILLGQMNARTSSRPVGRKGLRCWTGRRRSVELLCAQLAFKGESGLGDSATFTFSEVSLREVSVIIFSDEKLGDSGYLFQSTNISLCGTGMAKE